MSSRPLTIVQTPHNGVEPYRINDPVTGARIGGQVAYIRGTVRHKRFVGPLGRRWGKTTLRPFLWATEASFTRGRYTAGFGTANHTKAWEMFQFCKEQFGDLVANSVGEPESQNRYIDLHPIDPDPNDLSIYTDPRGSPELAARVLAGAGKNEGARIYFWSCAHPHYNAIQGFAFPFDRISLDEAQQQHPGVTRIVNPMLLDSGGALDVSGIPDIDSIGNDWFSEYFERGQSPEHAHRWAGLNFPTYGNPHLDKEAMAEIEADCLTNDDFEQFIMARFISGSGAVFSNLDKVFTLKPCVKREHRGDTSLPGWVVSLLLRAPSDLLRLWIVDIEPRAGHSYAMTVDFAGRTRTRDATVIGVYDMTRSMQVAVISIRGMPSPDQLAWIEGVKDQYGAHEVHGDETPEGAALMGYLRERYRTGVIGHNFSAGNKPEYVKRGVFLFEMAEVALIDCAEQRKEFKDFRRIAGESKQGRDQPVTYSHPPNKHDDFVASFLQIAPSLAHGRRAREEAEVPKAQLLDESGALETDYVDREMREETDEDEDAVNVRARR